ncbi:ATP-binding protein [Rhodococcus sp. Chr-9]|uniref:ATP-binding protein n=1 Tax=Rhodococcus sp. Chr-9 TaxID=713612 RepID=UPI0009FD86F9|nr:ATP-binding protein [Rhodococcus sp. Chr-9]
MDRDELGTIVTQLRRRGRDTAQVEVKSVADRVGKSLWPTISAFSNTNGGLILLGLDEREGFTPVPGFDSARISDEVKDAVRPRGPREVPGPLSPRPMVTIDEVEFEDATVVVLEVEELPAGEKPCFVLEQGKERGSYTRLSDGDHRMDTYEVFLMSALTVPSRADRNPVEDASIEDLDPRQIARTIDRIRTVRPRALAGTSDEETILERIGVLDRATKTPTLAGLLALGNYPQQFFPQLMISFAYYPGTDKSVIVGSERMRDRAVLEGPLPDMVDDAVSVVQRNLQVRRVSRGAGAEDVMEIPADAIREAIVNAVTHRDYSARALGVQVRVELYPDRLEVHSPGGLWGGRGIERIYEGGSYSRNEVLARLLTDVPFRDRNETVCENAGSGIPRMWGEMTSNGLPAPRFRSIPAQFTATLDRFGILNPDMRHWLDSLGVSGLSREQEFALALLHQAESLTTNELRQHLAVDSSVAEQALHNLVERQLATQAAERYFLVQASSAAGRYSAGDLAVIATLAEGGAWTVHQLATATGRTAGSLRPVLRRLVEKGEVVPTAPPTSKRRAYRLP